MEPLKGNSHVEREAEEAASDSKKPVTTNVVVKKAKRFGSRFFAEDAKTVGGHVVDSIIIPSAQKLLSDVVKGAIDWLIYGSKGAKPVSGPGQVSYTKYYTGGVGVPTPTYGNPMASRPNTVYAVNDVMFNDVSEAEEVLLRMNELVAKYQMVSVADFYDLIGQKGAYTDTKYGWRDLRTAEVVRNYTGWSIRFPPAKPLE